MLPEGVSAGVFFGTNMRPPFGGAIEPLPNAGRGIGLVQGTLDTKALPADALETYDQIQASPAALVTLIGANHYGINDVDNPPGADPDASAPDLDQGISVETTGQWSAMLLRAWVLGDAEAETWVAETVDTNVVLQQK